MSEEEEVEPVSEEEEEIPGMQTFVNHISSHVKDNLVYIDANALMHLFNEYGSAMQQLVHDGHVPEDSPMLKGHMVVLMGVFHMYQAFMQKHVDDLRFIDNDDFDDAMKDLLENE